MATIKTQGGLVLVKNGRVSCSCCGTDCCMYPAQYYQELFALEDLPEEVVAIGQDGEYEITFSKTGDASSPYTATVDGTEYRIIKITQGESEDPNIPPPAAWSIEGYNSLDDTWETIQDTSPNNCLIFEPFAENLAHVRDSFLDAYEVETYDAEDNLVFTDTYVRDSLCVWFGSQPESSLVFVDTPSESFPYGWSAEVAEFDGHKEGAQNTPVGEYPVTSGQFEGGKIVVLEPA